jgi:hypothetical protein
MMGIKSFERFGGAMGILAGISGLLYAAAFILLRNALLSSLFLMLIGFFSTATLVALYYRLRQTDVAFGLWALLVGLAGAMGSAIHGGYDLAYNVNIPSPAPPPELMALPSQIDPRGLLTFGFAGIALFTFSWLIIRSGILPSALGYLGYLSAVLLIVLYLSRLIVLDPANPVILVPALLNGFILNPVWYIWLGISLYQQASAVPGVYNGTERRMGDRRHANI